MTTENEKPVSETAMVSRRRRGVGNWVWLSMLIVLVTASAAGVTIWLDPFARGPGNHVTQWPGDRPMHPESREDDYEEAVERMEDLADGLLAYRRDFGGGLRWPDTLDLLGDAMLMPEDWDDTGVLSDKTIVYNPDMPAGHSPARWVLAHDTEIGWVRHPGARYASRSPSASAVILGDGSVKLLKDDELEHYGGLSRMAN